MAPMGAGSRRDATASSRSICITSLCRQSGLAQTEKIGSFGQGADLWFAVPGRFLDVCQARISLAQSLCLGELCFAPFSVALESISRRKIGVHKGQARVLAIGFFEPDERPVGMPLQQLHDTQPAVPWGNPGSGGAQAECL